MLKATTDSITLEQFLQLPELKPALEFIGGRIIQKMPPKLPHSVIQGELLMALNAFARPRKLGRAYPEL
jgi:Uma2 family endonuclease